MSLFQKPSQLNLNNSSTIQSHEKGEKKHSTKNNQNIKNNVLHNTRTCRLQQAKSSKEKKRE